MANGFKTGGKNFEKGKVSNPRGRPPVPDEYKKIQKLNADQVKGMIAKFARMTIAEMEDYLNSGTAPVFEAMIGNIIRKCLEDGDHAKLNFLLDRTIGKVKENVEVSLVPQITYKTTMTEDGRMIQDVIKQELPEAIDAEYTSTDNHTATETP